jgi:hypothetical protein
MRHSFLQRKWAWIGLLLIGCLAGLQFAGPRVNNPPVTEDIKTPDDIKQILKKACYDCHSNATRLAWFDQVAPASWLVAGHIRDGRKVLNFSEWDSLTADQQKGKLFESLNQMEYQVMPLKQYLWFHPSAGIAPAEIDKWRSYLRTLIALPTPDTAKTRAWEEQYVKWVSGATALRQVKPALNGVSFLAEYKDWHAISSTERFDNGTLRVILGNDIAVNAIKTQHINPWPDGTTFAKVAWTQVIDSSGNIQAGEFKQVEFMRKDKRKYASAEGWGFARWVKGTQLLPYGQNALFTTECTNCHKPMQGNDFVFTTPLNLNQGILLPNGISINPLDWKVVSSSVNSRKGTMSTLFGNDAALKSARTGTGQGYSPGSELSLVTWNQKEDTHWFGARIPGSIQSVEWIRFGDAAGGKPSPHYQKYEDGSLVKYEGNSLDKKAGDDPQPIRDRIAFILGLRASVMP